MVLVLQRVGRIKPKLLSTEKGLKGSKSGDVDPKEVCSINILVLDV